MTHPGNAPEALLGNARARTRRRGFVAAQGGCSRADPACGAQIPATARRASRADRIDGRTDARPFRSGPAAAPGHWTAGWIRKTKACWASIGASRDRISPRYALRTSMVCLCPVLRRPPAAKLTAWFPKHSAQAAYGGAASYARSSRAHRSVPAARPTSFRPMRPAAAFVRNALSRASLYAGLAWRNHRTSTARPHSRTIGPQ